MYIIGRRIVQHRLVSHLHVVAAGSLRFSSSSGKKTDPQALHRLFQEQMMDLKTEREVLFGFTSEDHDAWTNVVNHQHDQSLMDDIQAARAKEFSSADDWQESSSHTTETPRNAGEEVTGKTSLSHVSDDGRSVQMVDIAGKHATQRVAVAQTRVVFPPEVSCIFKSEKSGDIVGPKGPVFETAKLAGIMAAKKTSDLIPLCHPLPLEYVDVKIDLIDTSVAVVRCECRVTHKTGVEMEALTGASVAALTIYDMTKALSHRIRIEDTVLLSKAGGKRSVSTQGPEQT